MTVEELKTFIDKRDNELYFKFKNISERLGLLEEAMVYCSTIFKEMESKAKNSITDVSGNILTSK